MKRYQTLPSYGLLLACTAAMALQFAAIHPAWGQEAVAADPKHYTVEFENDQVRVRAGRVAVRCGRRMPPRSQVCRTRLRRGIALRGSVRAGAR